MIVWLLKWCLTQTDSFCSPLYEGLWETVLQPMVSLKTSLKKGKVKQNQCRCWNSCLTYAKRDFDSKSRVACTRNNGSEFSLRPAPALTPSPASPEQRLGPDHWLNHGVILYIKTGSTARSGRYVFTIVIPAFGNSFMYVALLLSLPKEWLSPPQSTPFVHICLFHVLLSFAIFNYV